MLLHYLHYCGDSQYDVVAMPWLQGDTAAVLTAESRMYLERVDREAKLSVSPLLAIRRRSLEMRMCVSTHAQAITFFLSGALGVFYTTFSSYMTHAYFEYRHANSKLKPAEI